MSAQLLVRESVKSETHWVPQDEQGFHDYPGSGCACHPDHTAERVWVHQVLEPTVYREELPGFPGIIIMGPAREC